MVGIAFGLKPGPQEMGDILVSRQIRDYKPRKVGINANNQLRGDLVTASIRPLDRFRMGAKYWPEPPHIHFGLILSGDDLVNNLEYRDQLHQFEPDAIGGEMEGACHHRQTALKLSSAYRYDQQSGLVTRQYVLSHCQPRCDSSHMGHHDRPASPHLWRSL